MASPHRSQTNRLVDHFFRQESGRLIASLTRLFGPARLELAEDVTQSALVRALEVWSLQGIPKNPSAWVARVAKNLAYDHLRREQNFLQKEPQIIAYFEQGDPWEQSPDRATDAEIRDDLLRMMFVCCHPDLPRRHQIVLILRILGGFSCREIAAALLAKEATIQKELTRGKRRLREADTPFELPGQAELKSRLIPVLDSLYLLFNSGYNVSEKLDDALNLCDESIRLTRELIEHPCGNQPETHALLALMQLTRARHRSRFDSDGSFMELRLQDRKAWDNSFIRAGMESLSRSACGERLSRFHLEAGIAANHAVATRFETTNWEQILNLYDRLVVLNRTPVVELNRAVALAYVAGPHEGLAAIARIRDRKRLDRYHWLPAVQGELYERLGQDARAVDCYEQAIAWVGSEAERQFLVAKRNVVLERVGAGSTADFAD